MLLGACARRLPVPITASQLAERSNGPALSAYLGQRDASAAVCDLETGGPHLATLDADVRRALMDGLRDGRIAPGLWSECAGRLVRSGDAASGALLLDAAARSYGEVIVDPRIESDPVVQGQLAALHALLQGTSGAVRPHAEAMTALIAELRRAMGNVRLGPVAERYATQLIAGDELSHGMRDGRPIDIAVLDQLSQAREDSTLQRYALRLPDSVLRSEARRRVIRLRIAQSRLPAVRDNAGAVEETLMRLGINAVSLAEHRPVQGTIDARVRTGRSIVVRQDVEHQTATLIGTVDDESSLSVLPQLSLRGALHLDLEGIDEPVTLCDSPEALDPAPCVSPGEVTLDSRLARLEPDGTIRFVDHLSAREALSLGATGDSVVIPVNVDGRPVAALEWGLRFETPNDLVFPGAGTGANGPALQVRVEPLASSRLSFTVSRGDRQYVAVVERDHATTFHVISQGSDGQRGMDGSRGRDGLSGTAGSAAICPTFAATDGKRGDDGSAGEDGGAGESGGDGGNVSVDVVTHGAAADSLVALVRRTILSRGGSGGAGGSGGSGGRGGAGGLGGAGATCVDMAGNTTFLSFGSSGLSGADGRSGFNGMSGSNGRDGHVTISAHIASPPLPRKTPPGR
jgi:hypothetical protein